MANANVHRQKRARRVVKRMVIVGVLILAVSVYQFETRVNGAGPRFMDANVAETMGRTDDAGAREAFLAAYKVFRHPRCMNCHPSGDIPLQGEDSHPHAQSVKRGPDGGGKYGMKCGACHQLTNLPGANMPPGVPKWHLPPAAMRMTFEGKSPAALCRQLKNPRENGGKTVEGAIEHLEADPLVLWGWNPGDGRSTPPLSHAEFLQKMRAWVDKGAACPE